jgi:uncharacterized heparinase superfamily protein
VGLRAEAPADWRPLAAGTGIVAAPQSGSTTPPEVTGVFEAVGQRRDAASPRPWDVGAEGLLFAFTLHAFDALPRYAAGPRTEAGDRFWTAVLRSWLDACAAPGLPGWHPYPLSRRLVAWCAALSAGGWPSALHSDLLASATMQVRYLRRTVEHDIGGNHVLENACALAIAGACLGDAGAQRHGQRLLVSELRRQILADGGHVERSPAYHRAVLERLEDARAVLARAGAETSGLAATCEAMATWLHALAGPDGTLPRLNDAWDGPPLEPATEPLTELAASGYVVLRHGRDQAVIDVAPLCPPHLPPHAHADALSFCLWLDGVPVVIDPGSAAYTGPLRGWSRATSSHATVAVAGEDQCQFVGDFRAVALPHVTREPLRHDGDVVVLRAEHDGYRRLAAPALHQRTFVWLPGDGLVVVDRIVSDEPHEAVSSLPLAPAADPALAVALDGAPVVAHETHVAPHLGRLEPAVRLEQRGMRQPGTPFGWALLRAGANARMTADALLVTRGDGSEYRLALAR